MTKYVGIFEENNCEIGDSPQAILHNLISNYDNEMTIDQLTFYELGDEVKLEVHYTVTTVGT